MCKHYLREILCGQSPNLRHTEGVFGREITNVLCTNSFVSSRTPPKRCEAMKRICRHIRAKQEDFPYLLIKAHVGQLGSLHHLLLAQGLVLENAAQNEVGHNTKYDVIKRRPGNKPAEVEIRWG